MWRSTTLPSDSGLPALFRKIGPVCGLPERSRCNSIELVDPSYKNAPSLTGKGVGDLFQEQRIGRVISAHPVGSAALGARHFSDFIRVESDLVLKILDGLDYRTIPHFSDQFDISKIPGLRANSNTTERGRTKKSNG
jgi:hypothetical protein